MRGGKVNLSNRKKADLSSENRSATEKNRMWLTRLSQNGGFNTKLWQVQSPQLAYDPLEQIIGSMGYIYIIYIPQL